MMPSPGAPHRSRSVLINLALAAIGCTSVVLYRVGSQAEGTKDIVWFIQLALTQSVLYLMAAWLVLRAQPARATLVIAVLFAALFRLSLVYAPPHLSDDIYRYVWDGRVQAAGVNPYRYIPADPALAGLRDDGVYPKINRRDYAHTIYPPVAEVIFFGTARISESVTWMKTTMVLFEAITCWALVSLLKGFGLAPQRVLIYAWHPLATWEFAGNGHVDAAALAFIMLALLAHQRAKKTATGVALACAALVKLFPVVLLPAFFIRGKWKMLAAFAATIVAGYLPYLNVGLSAVLGFLPGYVRERGLVSGEQFYVLSLARRAFQAPSLPNAAFLIFAGGILLGTAFWTLRESAINQRGSPRATFAETVTHPFLLAIVFTLLLAPHFPWYFAWLLPFLGLLPQAPFLYLTCASFMLYASWLGDAPDLMYTINTYLYAGCALVGAVGIWIRRNDWEKRKPQLTESPWSQ